MIFFWFTESERSGPLDTLLEGKETERERERSDWRPSAVLDKDVVSAMEAIEGKHHNSCIRVNTTVCIM